MEFNLAGPFGLWEALATTAPEEHLNLKIKKMKTLKMNFFSVLALIVAFGLVIGMSAFTSAENTKRTTYTFFYDGPSNPDVSEVEEEDHWTYDATPQPCDDEPETACTIEIDAAFVDVITDPLVPRLKQEAELRAAASDNSAYVISSDDENMSIANKSL